MKMEYKLDLKQEGNILWVTASGTRSLKAILNMSRDVMKACEEMGLDKALVDIRPLEGLLTTASSFTIPTRHFPKIRDQKVLSQLAIIDRTTAKLSNRFFENLAVKRGMNLKFFSDPTMAVTWLGE